MENRSIKIRVYPNEDQAQLIHKTFGCCRWYWNQALGDEQEFYAATDKHHITTPAKYKSMAPFLKEVDSLALCNTQLNLQQAFSSFFKGNTDYPTFKAKKRTRKSYTTNCLIHNGKPSIFVSRNAVKLPKLGWIAANIHRKPMPGWKLKSVTISENASGKYFASLLYEYEEHLPEMILPTEGTTLGLDYSSPKFYVDDQGRSPEKQRYFRNSEKKLAKLQRQLSRMVEDSKNYKQQKIRIAELQEHIANQRKDFAHQESRRITNSYNAVCVEDLNLHAMAQTLQLGKSTNDNGFGMFRTFLEYKLREQGKHLVVINKWFPSSKLCGTCGYINSELKLGQGEWICPSCGMVHARDADAARNIKHEGLRVFYEQLAASAA